MQTRVFSPYAKAFFQQIQTFSFSEKQAILEELTSFYKDLKQSDALDFLKSPIFSYLEKQALLEGFLKVYKFHSAVPSFLKLVLRNSRWGFFDTILADLKFLILESGWVVLAQLRTSRELTEQEQDRLIQLWNQKKEGQTIQFDTQVDPSLLGGIEITLEGVTYTATLKAQLEALKEAFCEMRKK